METLTQDKNKELLLANKCFIEGIYRLYALGHEKEAEALTALVNIARFNIEKPSKYIKEEFENDYVRYCWNLHNYSKSITDQPPNV